MRRSLSILGAISCLCTVGGAAGATDINGTITTIYPSVKAFTLNDGKLYELAPSLSLDAFRIGDRVKVTYATSGETRRVSKIEAAR